jgi:hypothetical protein
MKENSPLKGQFTRLKNQAKGQAKIGNISINNSQAGELFLLHFLALKSSLNVSNFFKQF